MYEEGMSIMKEEDRRKALIALKNLAMALNKYHSALTAEYVNESLVELQKEQAMAFAGSFLYFLQKSSNLRISEGIELNEVEEARWREVSSLKTVANGLFFGMGL
ncbi:hypothetical protein FD03_GL000737 [Companilactobacillus nodensis DSM 19682 = JCM 14932 = NBRC 107160]|uniref:Bacteriocin immunity protein n=1 Tax=Companilactobacillus nodensis DSM 19682 = JCM 14932 = NBRC 107160 TaxID=1423775 RepID=A0A0R1KJR0_9LACO|nr:hypothetical protein FD03_GL000737 [Companilactobacillus nodensis DSM 19682 = JCM 14932 = NBRC 107160]